MGKRGPKAQYTESIITNLTREQKNLIIALADERQISRSAVVRQLIENGLEDDNGQASTADRAGAPRVL